MASARALSRGAMCTRTSTCTCVSSLRASSRRPIAQSAQANFRLPAAGVFTAGSREPETQIVQADAWRVNSSHASAPPSNGRTRVTPYFLRMSAARALEASFGQVQKRTISRSRGISLCRAASSPRGMCIAAGIGGSPVDNPPRTSTTRTLSPVSSI